MTIAIERDPQVLVNRLGAASEQLVSDACSAWVASVLGQDFGQAPAPWQVPDDGAVTLRALRFFGHEFHGNPGLTEDGQAWRELIWPAFRVERATLLHQPTIDALFELAINGVLAERQPELRLQLARVNLDSLVTFGPWPVELFDQIKKSFLLVVRKNDGFADLNLALATIEQLRADQPRREADFFETAASPVPASDALRLGALYHLAKAVEITAGFVAGQYETRSRRQRLSARGVSDEIDRHTFSAKEFTLPLRDPIASVASRLGTACKQLVQASVFSTRIPHRTRRLLLRLASAERDRPVLELWRSQRTALQKSLLDPTKTAVVVSMPTSSGKTLLAEFAISNVEREAGVAVYLAPTRALVSQVSRTLRRDLGEMGLRVRVATPSFELNPVEEQVLSESFDILVTTPEKFDLLVRSDHDAVAEVALVVVDEAHGLMEKERGARLELLLALLRRERPETRYLLLTPFANNADRLSRWLGGLYGGAPIVIDWKPNDRIVGFVSPGPKVRNQPIRGLKFSTIESAHSDCPPDVTIDLGQVDADCKTLERLSLQAASRWCTARDGGVLLLAQTRAKAQSRATSLAAMAPTRPPSPTINLICRYLDSETGGPHPLSALLPRGVAFHHAGLSPDARYLVERLVEKGEVGTICATTTLAQGVHFPLSVAIFETMHRPVYRRGSFINEPLAPWELWNIAGRVGRAMEDDLGVVAFATNNRKQEEKLREYLRDDAAIVTSALSTLLNNISPDRMFFSTREVEFNPSLSAFLQYVLHAVAVSGVQNVERDIEGLLRASLVYSQAEEEDAALAGALVRMARAYVRHLQEKKGLLLAGFSKIADGTGFSSPSVDLVYARGAARGLSRLSASEWGADSLFRADGSTSELLTYIIDILHEVPEVRLGSEDSGEFNAERIARITTSWVRGTSLFEIAQREYRGDVLKCTHHVYSTISNLVPWGLRAVQRIAQNKASDADPSAEITAAMVYHGVDSAEGIALRMLGVPRVATPRLASRWEQERGEDQSGVADWLGRLQPRDWQAALPVGTPISGAECRSLWRFLEGTATWSQTFDPE